MTKLLICGIVFRATALGLSTQLATGATAARIKLVGYNTPKATALIQPAK
jgi:hypothetical protein